MQSFNVVVSFVHSCMRYGGTAAKSYNDEFATTPTTVQNVQQLVA